MGSCTGTTTSNYIDIEEAAILIDSDDVCTNNGFDPTPYLVENAHIPSSPEIESSFVGLSMQDRDMLFELIHVITDPDFIVMEIYDLKEFKEFSWACETATCCYFDQPVILRAVTLVTPWRALWTEGRECTILVRPHVKPEREEASVHEEESEKKSIGGQTKNNHSGRSSIKGIRKERKRRVITCELRIVYPYQASQRQSLSVGLCRYPWHNQVEPWDWKREKDDNDRKDNHNNNNGNDEDEDEDKYDMYDGDEEGKRYHGIGWDNESCAFNVSGVYTFNSDQSQRICGKGTSWTGHEEAAARRMQQHQDRLMEMLRQRTNGAPAAQEKGPSKFTDSHPIMTSSNPDDCDVRLCLELDVTDPHDKRLFFLVDGQRRREYFEGIFEATMLYGKCGLQFAACCSVAGATVEIEALRLRAQTVNSLPRFEVPVEKEEEKDEEDEGNIDKEEAELKGYVRMGIYM